MTVCTGIVSCPSETGKKCITSDLKIDKHSQTLSLKDIYKELRLRGYNYGPAFQGILSADLEGNFFNFYY